MARAAPPWAWAPLLLALAACSVGGSDPLPPPTSGPVLTTTTVTTVPDLSRVELEPVPGRTTTTAVSVGRGRAALTGSVSTPEGPVAGAVVRAERLVATATAGVDVVAGADGRWILADVSGGSYRVRAWRAPDLALVQPVLVYLADAETRVVDLTLERQQGPAATGAVFPDPPAVGQAANLVVQVTRRSVDARGVVRGALVPGIAVALTAGPGMEIRPPNPTLTDGGGRARWGLRCLAPGPENLSVTLADGSAPVPLALPDCRP